jgi:hypothetical protein
MLKTGAIVLKVAVECLARASFTTIASGNFVQLLEGIRHEPIDTDMSNPVWTYQLASTS